MNALELHGLEKHYPDFTLGPIDLELPGGTVCGLIGENGAGKSTTIKLILDMIDGDAGTVKLFGQEEITPLAKADIGVVLGGEGIPTCLTAPQVGKVMAGIYPELGCRRLRGLLPAALTCRRKSATPITPPA